jgi:hypothetical protein
VGRLPTLVFADSTRFLGGLPIDHRKGGQKPAKIAITTR